MSARSPKRRASSRTAATAMVMLLDVALLLS